MARGHFATGKNADPQFRRARAKDACLASQAAGAVTRFVNAAATGKLSRAQVADGCRRALAASKEAAE